MFLISLAAAQTWDPGATIDDGLRLRLTPSGLDAAADLAVDIVPDDPIPVPAFSGGTLGAGFPGCLNDYGYDISGGAVTYSIASASITPTNGQLNLAATVDVEVASPAVPIVMELGAACVEGDCDAYVTTFQVDVTAPVSIQVVGSSVVADIGTVSVSDNLDGGNVHVENCTAGTIIDAISLIYDPYDLLVDIARDQALALIPDLVDDLEGGINDALQVARFEQSLDLLGTSLDLDFAPADVTITSNGIDIQVSGSVAAEADPCIEAYDQGSRRAAGLPPNITDIDGHVGASVSSDLIDQGLYAIWRSGLLCYQLEGGEIGGFSLDTGLLGLLGGEPYQELFPESKPLAVRVVPTQPPVTQPSTQHDLAVQVEELGIDFYAELDGRQAHVFGLEVSPEVGLDTTFSNTFGTLEVDLALPETYSATLRGDPITPNANEVVADVEGVIATVASTALTDALGTQLSFEVPTYEAPSGANFGLRDLVVEGTTNGWTSAQAQVGRVYYNPNQGCDQGCQGSTGCSSTRVLPWFGGLLALVAMRRRRRDEA